MGGGQCNGAAPGAAHDAAAQPGSRQLAAAAGDRRDRGRGLAGRGRESRRQAGRGQHVRELFGHAAGGHSRPVHRRGARELQSTHIVAKLLELEHRPWAELGRSKKPLTTTKLASLLEPFKIAPTRDMEKRFYKRDALEKAWERYLPPLNPSSRHQASNGAASSRFSTRHATIVPMTGCMARKPSIRAGS